MRKSLVLYLLLLSLCFGCGNNKAKMANTNAPTDSTLILKYAENIKMERTPDGIKVTLANPWKKGETLHTYYLWKMQARPTSLQTALLCKYLYVEASSLLQHTPT